MPSELGQRVLDNEDAARETCEKLGIDFGEFWAPIKDTVSAEGEDLALLKDNLRASDAYAAVILDFFNRQNPLTTMCRKDMHDYGLMIGTVMFMRGLRAGRQKGGRKKQGGE